MDVRTKELALWQLICLERLLFVSATNLQLGFVQFKGTGVGEPGPRDVSSH